MKGAVEMLFEQQENPETEKIVKSHRKTPEEARRKLSKPTEKGLRIDWIFSTVAAVFRTTADFLEFSLILE